MAVRRANAILAAGLLVSACSGIRDPNTPEGRLASGKAVYVGYCASCHGESGDGQGKAAYLLYPKPRNFLNADFKLRSTPVGMLPTDEDLFKTITQGIPGTGMFAFSEVLSEAQRRDVVQYVKVLTPQFKDAPSTRDEYVLKIPAPPEPTPRLVALGKKTYEEFGCGKCHGPGGRGDGPAAATLVDSSGDPFPATDFTRGIYKSGGRPEDLYRTFLTGMAGTPMPSYQAAITSDEQAWGLVYYNFSLAPDSKPAPVAGDPGPIRAVPLQDASALDDPGSSVWSEMKPHRVYLRPLWYRNDYPLWILVRAARLDNRFSVQVEWTDPTGDAAPDREQYFADGVALQFALGDELPFIAMGDQARLVEIWQWRADRQLTADRGRLALRTDAYPNIAAVEYPLPAFNAAKEAGNILAAPGGAERPTHSLSAAGIGTLTAHAVASQRVQGRGVWKDGTYRAVFSVPAAPTNVREADFRKASVSLAIAVWDGKAGDRNGTKLVSQWVILRTSQD